MKHSYKIVSAMLAFAVGCGGGSKNENVVDLEAAQTDAPAVQQQPQRGAAFLDQGEDATKLWFEQLPEDITSSMLRESIAETFQKAPIERLDSRTVLRHAAGQRIRTNVAIPLDLEYDPRVPAHYKADDFSLDFGGWYGHAPKDPYRDLLLKSKGKLRCEAN